MLHSDPSKASSAKPSMLLGNDIYAAKDGAGGEGEEGVHDADGGAAQEADDDDGVYKPPKIASVEYHEATSKALEKAEKELQR